MVQRGRSGSNQLIAHRHTGQHPKHFQGCACTVARLLRLLGIVMDSPGDTLRSPWIATHLLTWREPRERH